MALPLFPARRPHMRPTAPEGSPAVIRERPRQSDRAFPRLFIFTLLRLSVYVFLSHGPGWRCPVSGGGYGRPPLAG